MDFPKKQQQCLIPRYLLQYLTSLEYHHTDPTAPWGGGGGGSYTAGDGIDITNDVISVDNTVALKTDLSDYVTSTALETELLDYAELSDLATVATSGSYNDLTNKPTIPTKTSDLTNDSGYVTTQELLANYVTLNGTQTISGSKTFTGLTVFKGTNYDVHFGQSTGLNVSDKNNPAQTSMSIYPYSISSYRETGDTTYDGKFYLGNHYFSAYNSATEYKIKLVSKGGATTYGEYTFKNKTGDVAITSEIPTATSDLTNDSGYITSSELTGYATETWVSNQGYLVQSDLADYITSTDLAAELLNYAELNDLATVATTGDYNDLTNKPDLSVYELAADAFSGDYNDLTNKPTIPVVPTNVSAFTNDAGYVTSSSLSGYVTTDTDQNITGVKTFVGRKKLAFKESTDGDFLGFTAYNVNGYEFGNLQAGTRSVNLYTGSTSSRVSKKLVTIGNYSDNNLLQKDCYAGFRVKDLSNQQRNFVLPKSDFSTYYNVGNADTYYVPMGITDGTTTCLATSSGIIDISSILPSAPTYTAGTGIDITNNAISIDNTVALKSEIPTVPTNVSAFTNDAGYITGITSTDVTTALGYTPGTSNFSGDYDDLTNKPSIPDAVSGTNDGTNWTSLTIGSDTYGIPSGGGSAGPTVTRYLYPNYTRSWLPTSGCTIYIKNDTTKFDINNTSVGDIIIINLNLVWITDANYNTNSTALSFTLIVPQSGSGEDTHNSTDMKNYYYQPTNPRWCKVKLYNDSSSQADDKNIIRVDLGSAPITTYGGWIELVSIDHHAF